MTTSVYVGAPIIVGYDYGNKSARIFQTEKGFVIEFFLAGTQATSEYQGFGIDWNSPQVSYTVDTLSEAWLLLGQEVGVS